MYPPYCFHSPLSLPLFYPTSLPLPSPPSPFPPLPSPSSLSSPFPQAHYMGKQLVSSERAQDHGCCDEAVRLLWNNPSPNAQDVTIKVWPPHTHMHAQPSPYSVRHFVYCVLLGDHTQSAHQE